MPCLDGLLLKMSFTMWELKDYINCRIIMYIETLVLWRHKHLTFLVVSMGREREREERERWVTHFVEVLILHSDSTDGVTGVDKFIQQSLLLLDTNLKSYWWGWWISVNSCEGRTVSVLIHWRWMLMETKHHLSDECTVFILAWHIMCWWIIK